MVENTEIVPYNQKVGRQNYTFAPSSLIVGVQLLLLLRGSVACGSRFNDPSMDGPTVILEETTPIRISKFHHKITMITENSFPLISSDPLSNLFLQTDRETDR